MVTEIKSNTHSLSVATNQRVVDAKRQQRGLVAVTIRGSVLFYSSAVRRPGLEVIKLEFILRLKIERNDWLLADTCPQAANHCALF